jgi:hypothetical protein
MGFLIRMVLWFSLVLLLLPFGPHGESGGVSAFQALLAARDAMTDVSGMCERRPEVCRTGRDAIETIGVRAREAARIAIGMLGGEGGGNAVDSDPAATTGSVVQAD